MMVANVLRFYLLGALVLTPAVVRAADESRLVEIEAEDVFIPAGFDDNDEIVVVVDGWLPDGCHRLTRPKTEIDHDTKTVTIQPVARYFDVPCIEARIPFSFEAWLGVLPEGKYQVKVAQTVQDGLQVAEATSAGPDDHDYAPVDSVHVDSAGSGRYVAVISGRLTNSCMRFKTVQIINSGKTIEVLPIIEMAGDDCVTGQFPYKRTVLLPANMSQGRHLVHVRSMNGRALNELFTVIRD